MSFRARRNPAAVARPFEWHEQGDGSPQAGHYGHEPAQILTMPQPGDARQEQAHLAKVEREAFGKGYEAGERAGAEAGATRAEAMLRRLAETLDELGSLRQSMIRQTERQMVLLALTVARRIVRREVTIDQDLTVAMARVALDRLGESASAAIRLHPDDYSATVGRHGEDWAGAHVQVSPDASVPRGGCLVQSDFGFVDASVDAQIQELARTLLADEERAVQPAVVSAR
jgi:flagellar assembly protein FliH